MTARLLTAVLLCGAGRLRRRAGAGRNVIVVAVRTPPNNLDPRQANDETSQRVGQLIFSSLMDVGPDLRAVPRLALRLDNPDPLTYVAHLRRGVKFHDGHEMTSKDVVYTYAAFLDPGYISPFKGAFRVLESVRAIDDYTVEFRLKEPFGAFRRSSPGVPPIVPAGPATRCGPSPSEPGPTGSSAPATTW
jgi:peptide/nickel transport system substrate-binding protein